MSLVNVAAVAVSWGGKESQNSWGIFLGPLMPSQVSFKRLASAFLHLQLFLSQNTGERGAFFLASWWVVFQEEPLFCL